MVLVVLVYDFSFDVGCVCCLLYIWIGLGVVVSCKRGFLWLRGCGVCLWCFFVVSL